MKIAKQIYLVLFLLAAMFASSSCVDDFGREEFIPPGESEIAVTVGFKSFTPALENRRSAGDAIKAINTLWVAVYNVDGTLVQKLPITDFTVNDIRPNDRPDDVAGAEEQTGHAEFKMRLNNGQYKIYAVANVDLSDKDVSREEYLKSLSLTWQTDDVAKNSQMFGWFSQDEDMEHDASDFDAPVVTVKGSGSMHAWVVRAALKLTIVYDGSGLNEGVFVYIKKAQIKDIPLTCPLGASNRPGLPGDPTEETELIDGETLPYYEGDVEPDDETFEYNADYKNRITRGGGLIGSHDEKAEALYFYENVQPKGEQGTMSDKRQDVTGANKQVSYPDGGNINNAAWKDARPYGTYVEITGYYVSINANHVSRGSIVYRFMLGKNVIDDYNAERNHHYKLTMKFNGQANDVDFHIQYRVPKPSINVPNPYYISYLYNHSMMLPVSISSGTKKVARVTANIKQNRWAPEGAAGTHSTPPEATAVYWNDPAVDDANNFQWNGFLSLRKTVATVLTNDGGMTNQSYYNNNHRGQRAYNNMAEGVHDSRDDWSGALEDDTYVVDIDDAKSDSLVYHLQLPMYTRAKQMIASTGYTGNNPYVAYQRKAVVTVNVWFEGNENSVTPDLTDDVTIYQVRLIVNPKGIYRSSGNTDPFHVTLRYLPREDATTFVDLESEGEWRAKVVRGDRGVITLSKSAGGRAGEIVEGSTGSKCDFYVNFTGKDGCAIIRVEYHNYSCYHLIFVRKGYEPIALLSGGAKWHCGNLRTRNEEVDNPMDEGSLFKFANLEYPIDASSNVNDHTPWSYTVQVSDFKDPSSTKFNIATDGYTVCAESDKKLWTDFYGRNSQAKFSDEAMSVKGRVAEFTDFNKLKESDDIGQGFGVLYADGATECANNVVEAYGYRWNRDDKNKCGMRGVFVYNLSGTDDQNDSEFSGRHIFLPIGNSGYGHRRRSGIKQSDNSAGNPFGNWGGVLRYAVRNEFYPMPGINDRPLFYDLWRRPGAAYYLNSRNGKNVGWDINYFTFDFTSLTSDNLIQQLNQTTDATVPGVAAPYNANTSAAFVRLVED